ncbi:peptidoglycan/xylan/chitin deacetylase (PgdA/CDA1 family) [Nonlabens xylanidelens]|uniref:Peptidoglycan/xylan/chitin deacetylase (PgdA/CDA1 family) n=1 Tax=Nonlabens xylanidelens TaxID=191564 RepID=A0A2S6IS16_9FLAO|nr:polysaccharide deacetylase family protein [Nonlabens xylanidelens]PPK96945.1 peptidoglycan/xylan/chitin deacetylase (PgdA/CDA1 family) [Nonlabens xylanidelens]PQJ13640.1 polysaccharide deacetylase family protein [Nonlabens xylanidelens]
MFKNYYWHGNRGEKTVYLTFDDGPTPLVTDYVINLLSQYGFKATFFCIGDKVNRYPETYRLLKNENHQIGNHTYHHLNAWTTKKNRYLDNIDECSKVVETKLFRPPYGRITSAVTQRLIKKGYKIVLWDVLSGDFDQSRTSESCLKNLKKNTRNGSIIVFHDSDKSFEKLKVILPEYLAFLKEKGWNSKSISQPKSI